MEEDGTVDHHHYVSSGWADPELSASIRKYSKTITRQTFVYGLLVAIILALLVVSVVRLVNEPHTTVVSTVCVVNPHTYHLTNCTTLSK